MKMYIAILDAVPDQIVPTLVGHSVLGAHLEFEKNPRYQIWLQHSFKKCTVRVNEKEFEKIAALDHTVIGPDINGQSRPKHHVYLGHENKTLDGRKSCAVVLPVADEDNPNVLKFAKLWKPRNDIDKFVEALSFWVIGFNGSGSDVHIDSDRFISDILEVVGKIK